MVNQCTLLNAILDLLIWLKDRMKGKFKSSQQNNYTCKAALQGSL